jgi:RNA polymerase sigma factor (sigma-70 family)
MAAASPVLNQINRWLSQASPAPDAELVRRFASERDEVAFAEIVDRHGPMVLGVARRVTGNHHLAEDVFQAAFLTLARRARQIRRPGALTAWLHQTAYRLARTAVRAKGRRVRAERVPAVRSQTDPLADLSAREVVTIIDDELRRLPDSLRQPLVLCCLEGRSQEEAAALLGWTAGSVRGRLERGRAKLAARLARRGLTLAVVAGPALLLDTPAAIGLTLREAVLGAAAGRVDPPPAAAGLLESGLRSATVIRRAVVAILVGLAGVGTITPVLWQTPPTGTAAPPTTAVTSEPDTLALPAGAVARLGWEPLRVGPAKAALSTDGKKVVAVSPGLVHTFDAATGKLLDRRPLGDRRDLPPSDWDILLSADGSVAAVEDGTGTSRCSVWDVAANRLVSRHSMNSGTHALSADGRAVVTLVWEKGPDYAIRVRDVTSSKEYVVDHGSPTQLHLSPDGKRLLAQLGSGKGEWTCYDVVGAKPLWTTTSDSRDDKVAFTADGRTVFLAGTGPAEPFRAIDVETGKPVAGLRLPNFPAQNNPAPAGDRLLLVPLKSGEVAVWDYRAGKELRRLRATPQAWLTVHVWAASDGKTAITHGDALRRWDLATGEMIFGPAGEPAHYGILNGVTFLPNGQLLSASMGGQLRRWDVNTGRTVGEPGRTGSDLWPTRAGVRSTKIEWPYLIVRDTAGKPVGKVRVGEVGSSLSVEWRYALAADGRTVMTHRRGEGTADTVAVYDYIADKRISQVEIPVPGQFDYFQGFSPCGRWVAANGQLFDTASAKQVWAPDAGPNWTALKQDDIVFSPDGRLACGRVSVEFSTNQEDFKRGEHDVWEIATGTRIARIVAKHAGRMAFSPDNQLLGYATGYGVHVVDLASGKLIAEYEDPGINCANYGFTGPAPMLAFSPDGRLVATGHYDGSVLVWKVPRPAATRLTPADRDAAWGELAGETATARRAVARLTGDPEAALILLKARFQAPAPPAAADVPALIRALDSRTFAEREKATARLREAGRKAERALRETLATATPEMKERINRVLADLNPSPHLPLSGENLRGARAIEVLERLSTPAAATILTAWSEQAANPYLAGEARLALGRLPPAEK